MKKLLTCCAVLLTLTACDPETPTNNRPVKTVSTEIAQKNITEICDRWVAKKEDIDSLLQREGEFNILKDEDGVPSELVIALNTFYRQSSIKSDPQGLRRTYNAVIDACNRTGWPFK